MRRTKLLLAVFGGAVLTAQAGWETATNGVMFSGHTAFSGCAPLRFPDARKRAIIEARRNMARANNISVGGNEKIHGEVYSRTVNEIAQGTVPPVKVLDEKTMTGQPDSLYCVLLGK
ncbi:MAG: hypothetical protein G3H99_04440 [Ferrovum sp.]|nr:hypothetical protein [Ferrovum sp.]